LAIPSKLQQLIDQGLEKLESDARHHLDLGFRELIYQAMGPFRFEPNNRDDSGHNRRVILAKSVVLRVLPLWEEVWPEDMTVTAVLDRIDQVMVDPPDDAGRDLVDKEISDLWDFVVELTDETREIAGVVGMAAIAAFSLSVWDGFMWEEQVDIDRYDSDDFMLNDVHFYAAAAFAGGPPYPIALALNPSSSARKEFWKWWLTEVVPSAWEAV